jgi:diguanylate cyclase (GGDEF)-like protein/PAS domain S-box-containing protein
VQTTQPDAPDARALERSLLDLVARLDARGIVTAVESGGGLLARDPAALVGRPLAALLDGADAEARLAGLLERARAGERRPPCELAFRGVDGRELTLEVVVRGAADGFLLGGRDVSARRRGERELEESRERYRLLFEQSPVGVIHYDAELRISDCNESFRRFLGSSYEQLVGLDMTRLRDQRVVPALRTALAGRHGFYEGPYEATTTAAQLWVTLRTVPFHGPDGSVQGGICIVEDVTQRRQVEEVQRATYEISEAVHDTADLGELFRSIHAVLARLMPADNVYFALYDSDADTVSFPYFVDQRDGQPPPQRARRGLTERVLRRGEALLADRAEIARLVASGDIVAGGTLPESWLGVPLRRGSDTIGAVVLQSYDPRVTFDAGHREVLVFVARQVAMAIERKRHEDQIEQMAFFDGLTGLYNRRMLHERAQQSLELARRRKSTVALLYLDLDRFKLINDTLGHDAGDELLAQIGGVLRGALRASDTLARLGGDEFAFVLDDADARRGHETARRILDSLDRPFELRGQQVRIGGSIGVAIFPEHGERLDELVQHADIAMYQAKARGGSISLFDPTGSPPSRHRLALESELRQGLAGGELELHYQPLLRVADGALAGFEALARWRHRGVLRLAADFVPLAEESDLIRLLDWQLLRQALGEMARLLPPASALQVAVNLSTRTLRAEGLCEHVAATLAETGLDASRVVIEITESAALADPERSYDTLRELVALGVGVAMDDFGTGFASLTYLRKMPLSRVKIDGSLISEIGRDRRGEELVQGAILLAHSLGLEVVAERVERAEQLDWLRERGCDLVQGYMLGEPMPAAEVPHWPVDGERLRELWR